MNSMMGTGMYGNNMYGNGGMYFRQNNKTLNNQTAASAQHHRRSVPDIASAPNATVDVQFVKLLSESTAPQATSPPLQDKATKLGSTAAPASIPKTEELESKPTEVKAEVVAQSTKNDTALRSTQVQTKPVSNFTAAVPTESKLQTVGSQNEFYY